MRYHFSMIINGEESLKPKIEQAIKNHPKIHLDLIKSFIQAVMLAFHLDELDDIRVEKFTSGRIPEEKELEKPANGEVLKSVDN